MGLTSNFVLVPSVLVINRRFWDYGDDNEHESGFSIAELFSACRADLSLASRLDVDNRGYICVQV